MPIPSRTVTSDKTKPCSLGPSSARTRLKTSQSQFPFDHSTRSSPLPFSRNHYELLCNSLHLPSATSGMLLGNTATSSRAHFQAYNLSTRRTAAIRSQSTDTIDKIGITMKFRGGTLLGMQVSLAISHCRSTNITDAALFCNSFAQAAYIRDAIARVAQVATHPGLIPAFICNFGLEALERKVDNSWDSLFAVETASGQTGILLVTDAGPITTGNSDDPDLSKKAIGVAQRAIAWESYSESTAELVTSVSNFVGSYNAVSDEPGIQTIQDKQRQPIEEYLSLVIQRGNSMQRSVRHLRARAEVQLSTVYNHLAQKSNQINLNLAESSRQIAAEAQKDAATMKSVAVLTMTFLPATFIAVSLPNSKSVYPFALFATPGVVSLSPSQGAYWAVTLPLTLLVLAIWICWTWLTMKRIDRSAAPELHHKDQT
ncbi:hypothetical protein GQ44DRAFT_725279 [Phaeosphaeriaceae sp. PMI808]|nr:hypothetical protein GQ44DRAFT_725279 [Phaeosphaeriaceae sp. PMI808]